MFSLLKKVEERSNISSANQIRMKLGSDVGSQDYDLEEDANQELHTVKLPFTSALLIVLSEMESNHYAVFNQALIEQVKMMRPGGMPITCFPSLMSILFIQISLL